MLHNTTWFESGWHETKVGTSVDEGSIGKELVWSGPETVRIPFFKISHFIRAFCSVWLFWISWSSDEELNPVFETQNNFLSNVEDQMDSFLFGNSSYESKKWDAII